MLEIIIIFLKKNKIFIQLTMFLKYVHIRYMTDIKQMRDYFKIHTATHWHALDTHKGMIKGTAASDKISC